MKLESEIAEGRFSYGDRHYRGAVKGCESETVRAGERVRGRNTVRTPALPVEAIMGRVLGGLHMVHRRIGNEGRLIIRLLVSKCLFGIRLWVHLNQRFSFLMAHLMTTDLHWYKKGRVTFLYA
ncbi:hypothetical protein PIB30_079426 [Stylosanthes scabra]|uniref:Uncharacterized protein n=1 Tax=Stylosanthes scabra TaxID=79078 RepID=A0ABU6QSC8_9FABA|nr:hypothetical protein [Stylosanthes scabra]